MKTTKYIASAIASMALAACSQEINPVVNETTAVEKNPNLVEITLTANSEVNEDDTKATFINYPKLGWEKGDKVSILGLLTGNQQFTADSKGNVSTFTGEADPNDALYYGLYPYDENVTITEDGVFENVIIPAVQTATAGSFDPKAYVAIAKSEDKENLYFKGLGTFLKFNIKAFAGMSPIKTITVTGNNNEVLAGKAAVTKFNDDGGTAHSNLSGSDAAYSVTLEGTFDTEKAYFMMVRPQPYTNGITVQVELEDGTLLTRSGSKQLFKSGEARNSILTMVLDPKYFTEPDPFTYYNMGRTLTIGGVEINKETYGEATLITGTSGLDKSGVYFVNGDATANFNSGITGKLIVIGNTPGTRARVTRSGVSYITASEGEDVLIMNNVKYDDCTANLFQLNAGKPFETIIFDDCQFNVATNNSLLLSNSAANTVTNFAMTNCDVEMGGAVSLLKMGGSTINNITLDNNVLYSNSEMTSFLAVNSTAKVTTVVFNNNTLYNTTIGTTTENEDAIIKASTVTAFTAKNNYLVYANSTANRYLGRATFTGGEVDNNFYVRKAETSTAIYGVPGTKPDWVINQPAVKGAPANLTTNWDPANGKYILGGFTGVGATR